MNALILLLSPIGRWLAGGLVISAALWGAYNHVKGLGYAECKSQWDAANAKNIRDGAAARSRGERDAARGVRDGYDRDK
jgi:hypothetical protein